ncbi:unnamed protein product [Natator depressus]
MHFLFYLVICSLFLNPVFNSLILCLFIYGFFYFIPLLLAFIFSLNFVFVSYSPTSPASLREKRIQDNHLFFTGEADTDHCSGAWNQAPREQLLLDFHSDIGGRSSYFQCSSTKFGTGKSYVYIMEISSSRVRRQNFSEGIILLRCTSRCLSPYGQSCDWIKEGM